MYLIIRNYLSFLNSATNGSPHVRSRNQLTHQGSHTDARMILLRTKEARITRIALGIVSLYILCHIWRLVPNIYDVIYGSDKQYPRWLEHLVGFSHIMVVFNSAINFLLYLVLWDMAPFISCSKYSLHHFNNHFICTLLDKWLQYCLYNLSIIVCLKNR